MTIVDMHIAISISCEALIGILTFFSNSRVLKVKLTLSSQPESLLMVFTVARSVLSMSTGLSQTSWQWLNRQWSRGENLDASEPVGRPFVLNKRGRLCCAWPCSLVYSGLHCLLSFLLSFRFIFPHLIAPLFHCPVASKVLMFSTCCQTIKRDYKTVCCEEQSSVRVAAVAGGHYGGPC